MVVSGKLSTLLQASKKVQVKTFQFYFTSLLKIRIFILKILIKHSFNLTLVFEIGSVTSSGAYWGPAGPYLFVFHRVVFNFGVQKKLKGLVECGFLELFFALIG